MTSDLSFLTAFKCYRYECQDAGSVKVSLLYDDFICTTDNQVPATPSTLRGSMKCPSSLTNFCLVHDHFTIS